MPKVNELFAFIVADKDSSDEGIMAFLAPGGLMMPMVGADITRVKALIPVADHICRTYNKKYTIKKFKFESDYVPE